MVMLVLCLSALVRVLQSVSLTSAKTMNSFSSVAGLPGLQGTILVWKNQGVSARKIWAAFHLDSLFFNYV